MFARHTYVTGDPRTIDDAILAATKQGRELLREQPGYGGMVVFADRDLGKLLIGSFWGSEQAARASDEALREQRVALLRPFAATISSEIYEVAATHHVREPAPGAASRRMVMEFDPAETDRLVAFFNDIAPMLGSIPGFCRATVFVDRARGRSVLGTVYTDRESLTASRSAAAALRAEVAQKAAQPPAARSLEEFEVVLFEGPPA